MLLKQIYKHTMFLDGPFLLVAVQLGCDVDKTLPTELPDQINHIWIGDPGV